LVNIKTQVISNDTWIGSGTALDTAIAGMTTLSTAPLQLRGNMTDNATAIGYKDVTGYYFEYRIYQSDNLSDPSSVQWLRKDIGTEPLQTLSWTIDLTGTNAAEGVYWLDIRVKDEANNTNDTVIKNIAYTIDTLAPVVTISTPPLVDKPVTASFALSGTITESNLRYIKIMLDGSLLKTINPGDSSLVGGTTWNLTKGEWSGTFGDNSTGGISQGTHTITVVATDYSGKTNATVPSYVFVKDTVKPEVTASTLEGTNPTIQETNAKINLSLYDATSGLGQTKGDNNTTAPGVYYFEYRIYKADQSPTPSAEENPNWRLVGIGANPGQSQTPSIPLTLKKSDGTTNLDYYSGFWNNLDEIPDGLWKLDVRVYDRAHISPGRRPEYADRCGGQQLYFH